LLAHTLYLFSVADFSQLVYVRPIDRGYVVDAPTQAAVWQHAFQQLPCITAEDTHLLLTSPPFVMRTLEAAMGELVFESQGFASLVVELPATLASHHRAGAPPSFIAGTSLTIDSGYSFSHIVPVYEGRPVMPAIRR
jgi:actin-related protein 6